MFAVNATSPLLDCMVKVRSSVPKGTAFEAALTKIFRFVETSNAATISLKRLKGVAAVVIESVDKLRALKKPLVINEAFKTVVEGATVTAGREV